MGQGHWNYRVHTYETAPPDPETVYEVIECYYDEDGQPKGWCRVEELDSDSIGGLRDVMAGILRALEEPVLTDKDFH